MIFASQVALPNMSAFYSQTDIMERIKPAGSGFACGTGDVFPSDLCSEQCAMWIFAIPCFQPSGPLHFMEILTEGHVRAERDAKWKRGMLDCSQANHDNSSGHDLVLHLKAHFLKSRLSA